MTAGDSSAGRLSVQAVNPVSLVLGAGLSLLVLPSLWDLLAGRWASYSQGHELLVLGAAAWLAWQRKSRWMALPTRDGSPALPIAILGFGLTLYAFGRTQQFVRLELLSLWVILAAMLLWSRGSAGLRLMLWPMAFALFALPLPYAAVLALTGALKTAVSAVTVTGLQALGYPVGRTGVVITAGQYQLLVAEACAGLQTMFSLEAFSLFYTQLMNYTHWQRTALMATLAVPVAFLANVVRTSVLVLVTYHFGDAVGQGFVHGFAGIVLFVVALLLLHGLDRAMDRALPAAWR